MSNPNFSSEIKESEAIKQNVVTLLTKYSIPFEKWGQGSAKTLQHLIKEVLAGETVLEESPEGLARKLSITYIDIFFTDAAGKTWKLVEEKQIFKDGRERRRNLDGSIAEKLKAGEMPDQKMVDRAIQEELAIEGGVPTHPNGSREITEDSPSYPGLTMKATNYYFEGSLNQTQFRPEGYIEHQTDKDNYFVWKEI